MSLLNRLFAIVPGFGNPFVNDTLFLSNNNALTTSNTITLTSLSPTVSKGYIRTKIYGGNLSATMTLLSVAVGDGTQYAQVYYNSPSTAITLSTTVGGTSIATNGAMTTATATLTSTSNPFLPSQVGLPIQVPGAGNAAGTFPLQTTISAFVSTGNVTLAAVCANTAGVSSKTITLTGQYFNGGSATQPAGFDVIIPFEVDMSVTNVVITETGAGGGLMDVEVSGTI